MTNDSIEKIDIDIRAEMYKNILLSGGSTLFKNFASRFESEFEKMQKIKSQ